jgi:hypothetical protein
MGGERPRGRRPAARFDGRRAAPGVLATRAELLPQRRRLDFKPSGRGVCYVLENEQLISKGDFDRVEKIINDLRKSGHLPLDFTADDQTREPSNAEELHDPDPAEHADWLADWLRQWEYYRPVSFWANQAVYVEVMVEKIDLKSLFDPVCAKYCVRVTNAKGWSDINSRAKLMKRFQVHEKAGRDLVLLCANDFDPWGLLIPDMLMKNFRDLSRAVGWSPENLQIVRIGLNIDFIRRHRLSWIDGLQTGSGMDLGDPGHKLHNSDHVQAYIKKFGKRKVEANALVVRPEAGRRLCRDAIERYIDQDAVAEWEQQLEDERERCKAALPKAVKKVLQDGLE